jgi:hypothetical protein
VGRAVTPNRVVVWSFDLMVWYRPHREITSFHRGFSTQIAGRLSKCEKDSTTPHSTSLSPRPLRRHSSSVRAGCVNALVRICAGGDQQWSSLPRQLSATDDLEESSCSLVSSSTCVDSASLSAGRAVRCSRALRAVPVNVASSAESHRSSLPPPN